MADTDYIGKIIGVKIDRELGSNILNTDLFILLIMDLFQIQLVEMEKKLIVMY